MSRKIVNVYLPENLPMYILAGLFLVGIFALLLAPVTFDLSGTWSGDISINKNDPHWGVTFMDMKLDKSTSLQVTGVDFHLKTTMPAYMVNGMFGGR